MSSRLVCLISTLAAVTNVDAAPFYSNVDLSVAGRTSYAAQVNNHGQVTFSVFPESESLPGLALLVDERGITNLGGLGGTRSIAGDINDVGTIAGFAELPDGTLQTYIYQDGELSSLGRIGTEGSI